MPRISLTDFVDIVARVGMQKITKIRDIKNRDDYSPQKDYWKILRDHITNNHSHGGNRDTLLQANELTQNQNKITNYQNALDGYKKFLGKKNVTWFNPPSLVWNYADIDISLNPELGLLFNNEYHVIKLYFKAEPLSKAKTELILFLLNQVMPQKNENGNPLLYSIVDTQKAKHLLTSGFNKNMIAALNGEAQYISTVWPSL